VTDEWSGYFSLGDHFASHESVSHKADEYVRGEVHTMPIRLTHTPTTCRVRPVAGIKSGICRRHCITSDAE